MNLTKQTIALATLAISLSSGLALVVSPPQAQAQTVRQGRTAASPSVQPHRPARLAAPALVNSSWRGNIHANGDDALTYLALQMNGNGSSYQGAWQMPSSDGGDPDDEGTLSASRQGNTITIELAGWGNQTLVLTGTVSANGTVMSGQVANSNLWVFYFTKN